MRLAAHARTRSAALSRAALRVGPEAGEDRVADLPFQRAQRFPVRLGLLLVIVGAALAMRLADLGDGGHVDGVVDPPVPPSAEPVDLAAS